jgi:hypothetical protein
MPDSMPVQQPEPAQNWCTGFLAGFKPMSRNIFGARRNGSLICYSAYTGAVQWAPNKSGGKPTPPISLKPFQMAFSPKTELTQKSLMGQFGGRMCVYGLGNIPNELIETIPLNSMVFPIHLLKLY